MKTLPLLASILFTVATHAQTLVRTDLQIAATITNSATYAAGTNFLDASRYSEVGFELRFAGSGDTTNNLVVTFKRSADGTNYESQPFAAWLVSSQGTNSVRAITNFTLGAIGYFKPFQIVSTNASDLTNAALFGYLKGYRRD